MASQVDYLKIKMATKKAKLKKDSLFEAEEFELENQDEIEEEAEPEMPEDIDIDPAEIVEEEVEPVEDVDLVSLADTIGAVDEEGAIHHIDEGHEKDEDSEELDEEISDSSALPQASTVRICPHCNEEVLDLEVCPLCGNPLNPSVDDVTSGKEIDADGLLLDFDEEESKAVGMDNMYDDKYEELFDDLPYQDKY